MSQTASDEIDLQEIAINVIRYFSRYYKFIFICAVLGGAFGFGVYKVSPHVYESKMIVMSDVLTEPYANRLSTTIVRLIREKNDYVLASKLNVSTDVALALQSFDIQSVEIEDPVTKDGEKIIHTMLTITVEILDDKMLPVVQEGIMHLLAENEYTKVRTELSRQKYQAVSERIQYEIKGLDSLKRRLFPNKASSGKPDVMIMDPANIYSQIVALTAKLMESQEALALSENFELVEGFTAFKKPDSPKLSIALAVGLALGFLGGIGILTIRKLIRLAAA